jgi:hypothetical protein
LTADCGEAAVARFSLTFRFTLESSIHPWIIDVNLCDEQTLA